MTSVTGLDPDASIHTWLVSFIEYTLISVLWRLFLKGPDFYGMIVIYLFLVILHFQEIICDESLFDTLTQKS